jgi:hypothetical protein
MKRKPQPALIQLGAGGYPLGRKADREAIDASRRDDPRNAGDTNLEPTLRSS